jgi:hypothetical protein
MTIATITKINAAIAAHGVEVVKGNGYFYFADLPSHDAFTADRIPSVYSAQLRCMTLEQWAEHVEDALCE